MSLKYEPSQTLKAHTPNAVRLLAPREPAALPVLLKACVNEVDPGARITVREREFFIDNFHFIIVMIRWTGLAPWEFEFPFPGSLTSTFLGYGYVVGIVVRLGRLFEVEFPFPGSLTSTFLDVSW